jgi:glucose-1-phosphate thymidylyltransferase
MKGIVLAGGTGSRLYPLTKVTNKHLLPIARKPMIYYPIEKFIEIGIKEILIVTGTEHMGDVVGLLGSGKDFGCNFTYKVQDEAGGIAQALLLGENFAGGDSIAVILGDNIFEDSLSLMARNYEKNQNSKGARIALKEVPDPQRFGVATLKGEKVVKIVEKPSEPESTWAVTGIYFYDSTVFDIIKKQKPSGRGEMEITDVNNAYIDKSDMGYDFLKGWWTDAGTFESLKRANELLEGQDD